MTSPSDDPVVALHLRPELHAAVRDVTRQLQGVTDGEDLIFFVVVADRRMRVGPTIATNIPAEGTIPCLCSILLRIDGGNLKVEPLPDTV